jgi:hypothetical protein
MQRENFVSAEGGERKENNLRVDHLMIRRLTKDLLERVQQSSLGSENRDKLLKLVNEILSLVPIYSLEDEERDEFERKVARGETDLPDNSSEGG